MSDQIGPNVQPSETEGLLASQGGSGASIPSYGVRTETEAEQVSRLLLLL